MGLNHFVCTLGQADALSVGPKPYRSIGEFIRLQAQNNGHLPAVGFPIPRPGDEPWSYKVLTFRDIAKGTQAVAHRLTEVSKYSQTVALLAHSSPEFLLTWLALIRLGHSVLLIAPQCQPSAIVHLCKSCHVSLLLHDDTHKNRAEESFSLAKGDDCIDISIRPIPFSALEDAFESVHQELQINVGVAVLDETAIAYLHHTSGTSSGLPKPIPQTHQAAIGVLPHLRDDHPKATFTTTPLYHGGIADLFRSWTSDSCIWLFPSKHVPITALNICRSLDVAHQSSMLGTSPEVAFFSSVPYVLQMMEADESGLSQLKSLDIVGVGGAALPTEVGDRLVARGVNLISRFGSAECGFLLSSYRDFGSDNEWQYLRNYNTRGLLAFDAHESGLSELVVKPGWPHMAKTNRPDGSFATADLFAAHSTIGNAWLYHSRADSQLTLITGKKFDPAPLEAAIATSPYLDDVLIFGNGKPVAGALLIRSKLSEPKSDPELLYELKPVVSRLNMGSESHAQLPENMLIILPHQEIGIEKSSKGTIIRRTAEERFKEYIEQAYESLDLVEKQDVTDENISEYLISLVGSMVPDSVPLGVDTDLFSFGIDSIASMRLRNHVRSLLPSDQEAVPLSIIEDCGSIRALGDYIVQKRHGANTTQTEDEEQVMRDLVKRYSIFDPRNIRDQNAEEPNPSTTGSGENVILTGATGALGAHILDLLRRSNDVTTIYCLVRGTDEHAAKQRVSKALEQKGFESLDYRSNQNQKIKVIKAQLADPALGISTQQHDELVANTHTIIHVAWTVNFRIKLRSFEKDNIAGVKHLLDLALKCTNNSPPRFIYCSSTAAIMNAKMNASERLPERILSDPSCASPLGYSRSKWVAEQICWNAQRHTGLKDRIAVVRVGQLSGDLKSGIWNTSEAWPLMLSTMSWTGSLPNLTNEPLDWLPVDIAAKALLECQSHMKKKPETGMHVFHVLNEHRTPSWNQMLQWLQSREDFEVISPEAWVHRLEAHQEESHPALKLLGLWKEAYCTAAPDTQNRPEFSLTTTKQCIPILGTVRPIDETYISKIWSWVKENVH
ncbi:male sterility protein-domain-containing protein [Dendryphion nanum]|uniref:Male sterility protein-domain-containing protein n=1 Tax=Dendryphion nanum TaxID=256645 RepID=A0A9P9E7M5_9PLEO|nr:male sterility protein-domain-containing protein [Dendryphion nanum]